MLRTRVIPCLLLKNTGLVKTVKFRNPNYIGDPLNAVKIFNEKEVDELIFLDITATKENRPPQRVLIEQIANECFMPFCYGGGIRDLDTVREIFRLGVEKVSISSYAVENPEFIRKASETFGSQSIIVTIDVKKNIFGKYRVYTHNASKNTGINPIEFAKLMEKMGAGELCINSVDRDGTMQGYDIELLKSITDVVSMPVIACGGAGKLEDFSEAVDKANVSALAAGSMFVYYGRQKGVLINFPLRENLERILN